jgi:hypothetical protein
MSFGECLRRLSEEAGLSRGGVGPEGGQAGNPCLAPARGPRYKESMRRPQWSGLPELKGGPTRG